MARGDIKANFSMDLRGDKKTMRALRKLPVNVQRNATLSAARKAMKPLANAMKSGARRFSDSGLLAKSIGVVGKNYKRSGIVVVLIGVRKGFTRQIGSVVSNPRKYAHLVEFGTKPHVIKAKKAGGVLKIGQQTVRGEVRHPGTAPQGFMRKAFNSKVGAAERKFAGLLAKAIATEAAKLRAK